MSETRRYEGPVKAGMKYRYGSSVLAIENGDAKRDDFVGLFRDGRRTLVRPADDDAAAWARFLPDELLANTGAKDLKVGQTWAISNDYARLVFRIASLQGSSNGRESTTRKSDRIVLAGTDIPDSGDAMNASGMMRNAVLLFDAEESRATGPIAGKAASGCEAWCGLPSNDPRVPSSAHVFMVGLASQSDPAVVKWLTYRPSVGAAYFGLPALCSHACAVPENAAGAPVAPVKREPVAPWRRLKEPGRYEGGSLDGLPWTCTNSSMFPHDASCVRHAAFVDGPEGHAACEGHALKMGVLGQAGAKSIGHAPGCDNKDATHDGTCPSPVFATPASKPTHVEAKANVTKPCPACNGIPFEAKRCPRCGLPSKAEPVRVRLAPVGGCRGPLTTHGTPVMRVRGSLLGGPSSFLMCDPCYLHAEKLLADDSEAFRRERAACTEPPARIGTVPMSIGPGAGVGVWASRGMR